MKTSVTFLIVRHPFERLLSAYRDKIQFAIPYTFHQKLGNQIIRKYRHKVSLGLNSSSNNNKYFFYFPDTKSRHQKLTKISIIFGICNIFIRRKR